MKITFDIDCSPEEARRFLGLPDVKAMQDKLIEDMQAHLQEGMKQIKPEDMMTNWMKASMESMAATENLPNATKEQLAAFASLGGGQQGLDQVTKFWSKLMQPSSLDIKGK